MKSLDKIIRDGKEIIGQVQDMLDFYEALGGVELERDDDGKIYVKDENGINEHYHQILLKEISQSNKYPAFECTDMFRSGVYFFYNVFDPARLARIRKGEDKFLNLKNFTSR